MITKKLTIEMGKVTGEIGLQVYERLKSQANDEWNRLQMTQLRKSYRLSNIEAVMEKIVVKALVFTA